MKDLKFLEENGVDISKFITSTHPNFNWNITKQSFSNENDSSEDTCKIYTLQSVKLNLEYLKYFKEHRGFVAWRPCNNEEILRFAILKEGVQETKYYVFVVYQDDNLKIIPDFKVFDTEEEVLNHHSEKINDENIKIVFFNVIEGVEKKLEPFEVVTKYQLK